MNYEKYKKGNDELADQLLADHDPQYVIGYLCAGLARAQAQNDNLVTKVNEMLIVIENCRQKAEAKDE